MQLKEVARQLYRGESTYDFIGRKKLWYSITAAVIAISVLSLVFIQLNLGIEFTGGTGFQFKAPDASVERAEEVLRDAGVPGEPVIQKVGGDGLRIKARDLPQERIQPVVEALAKEFGIKATDISPSRVGPNWGRQVSEKALQGLVAFLLLVFTYISIRFEWKMAIAAIAAVIHDLIVTAGLYALIGFEVTPSTVIALLTILGYSLYDTIVVFDRVREDTATIAGGSRLTYSQAANQALNETVMRSVNTSLTSLIPVGALLFVGAGLLKAGSLKDLSLALFIGLVASTYSSIFVATPLLTDLKEREKQFKVLASRVQSKRVVPAVVGAGVGAVGDPGAPPPAKKAPARGAPRAQQRRKGGRGGRPGGKKRR